MEIFNSVTAPEPIEINLGVEKYKKIPEAILLDVRTRKEYAEGYIGGSFNLPIDELDGIAYIVKNPATPIFVYCRSGRRSARAASFLRRIGYREVYDIGGILDYKGEIKSIRKNSY